MGQRDFFYPTPFILYNDHIIRKPESSNFNVFEIPDQVLDDDKRTFYESINYKGNHANCMIPFVFWRARQDSNLRPTDS